MKSKLFEREIAVESAMPYRKDIQILRGISILLVVLFHLKAEGFTSGFLGVDIFFVVSGFLMACLYDPARKANFLVKRASRILPAYFTVIVSTLALSVAITTPNDLSQVIEQSIFATAFLSNIGFWFENSYFDKAAFKPLLHFWSLGVEIQFYLLVPLLHWLVSRSKFGYWVLLLASLLACFFIVGISPKTSFFMMPLRLWEFLLGYGVATYGRSYAIRDNSGVKWIGVLGLAVLIAIPMMRVDGTTLNYLQGHPGMYALAVALATSIVLAVGLPESVENLKVALIFEKLGKYSYSIYLVHFPVIVLFLYRPFSGTVLGASRVEQIFFLIAIIGIASTVLYNLVERPLRYNKSTSRWLLVSAFAVLVLCPIGIWAQKLIFPDAEMAIYQAWTDRDTYRCGKLVRVLEPNAKSCEITKLTSDPIHRVLLVGDSHADSVKKTFRSVAESKNISVRFIVENAPLRGSGMTPESLVQEAELRKAQHIVMHYSPGGIDVAKVQQVVELADQKHIAVSFIMPVPTWNEHVPMALWKNFKEHTPLPQMTIDSYLQKNSLFDGALSNIRIGSFTAYRVVDFFCQTACQIVEISGKPLYFDDSHLTVTGSERLRGLFETIVGRRMDLHRSPNGTP